MKSHGPRCRKVLKAAALGAIALTVTVAVFFREPRYGGKTVRDWSAALPDLNCRVSDRDGIVLDMTNAAVAALQVAGSDAVPRLRSELRARDSVWYGIHCRLYYGPPAWLYSLTSMFPFLEPGPTSRERHKNAGLAACVLGKTAQELAPDLARLLDSQEREPVYAFALARMGTNGLPGLIRALSDGKGRLEILVALEWTDADLAPALPSLLNLFTNGVEWPTLQDVLVKMDSSSNTILPVVQAALGSPSPRVRANAEQMVQAYEFKWSGRGMRPDSGKHAWRLEVRRDGFGLHGPPLDEGVKP